MRRFMTILAGAACGALVGAVVALLLAPFSGEQLRSQARQRVADFGDELREAYSARRAQLESELEALRAPRKSG